MKILVLALLILTSLTLWAQPDVPRRFHWGLVAAMESQLLGVQSLYDPPGQPPKAEAGRPALGWSVGMYGGWRLAPVVSLQSELTVSSTHNTVLFRRPDPAGTLVSFRFTDVELPVHLVFTNRSNAFPVRGLFLLGARLSWNFADQSGAPLTLLRERAGLDAGLGVEIRLGRWRIQPEVVYSHGLNNLHDFQDRPYDAFTGRIMRDRLSLRVLCGRN
jgi:hypothetical protein